MQCPDKENQSFHLIILCIILFSNINDRNDDWQQAETLMTDYRVLLEKREGLHTDAKELENQNHALEEELRSRLKDKVNEELAFPPSNAISVGDEVKK